MTHLHCHPAISVGRNNRPHKSLRRQFFRPRRHKEKVSRPGSLDLSQTPGASGEAGRRLDPFRRFYACRKNVLWNGMRAVCACRSEYAPVMNRWIGVFVGIHEAMHVELSWNQVVASLLVVGGFEVLA